MRKRWISGFQTCEALDSLPEVRVLGRCETEAAFACQPIFIHNGWQYVARILQTTQERCCTLSLWDSAAERHQGRRGLARRCFETCTLSRQHHLWTLVQAKPELYEQLTFQNESLAA